MSIGNVVVSQDAPAKNNLWIQPRGTARFWNGNIWKVISGSSEGGGGSGDLSNYYTKVEIENRYYNRSWIDSALESYILKTSISGFAGYAAVFTDDGGNISHSIHEASGDGASIRIGDAILKWENGGIHVYNATSTQENPTTAGIYADWVSALGANSQGGSSGGDIGDLDWGTLTNWDEDPTHIININYLPINLSNGVITIGNNSITPLTSHQDISGKADKSEMSVTTGNGTATIQLKSGTSATVLTQHQDISGKADKTITITGTNGLSGGGTLEQNRTIGIDSTYKSKIDEILSMFELDSNGNIKTKDKPNNGGHRGFYSESFISALGSNSSSGGGGNSGSGDFSINALWNELRYNDYQGTSWSEGSTKIINGNFLPLNGTSAVAGGKTFYAPTSAGTSGKILAWPTTGSTPTWISQGSIAAGSAVNDGAGNVIANTYLPLSGGTMTGTLTAKGSVYDDAYTGALNMNNSNIYGLNAIYTADLADSASEGFNFYRTSTTVDSLWIKNGIIYFTPNRTLGYTGTDYKVLYGGNSYVDGGKGYILDTEITTISGSSNTVDGYHADITSANNLIRVIKGSDSGIGANGYYAGMSNFNAGDGSAKWWHILSMDWSGNDANNWQSQLILPTQQGGVPKYRRNTSGGTSISSSTWHNFITDENISSQTVSAAATLQTSRTIWGQSFNGSSNVDGLLKIQANAGNWCEGIRIKPYSNWSTIVLGGNDLSADTGTSANTWSIHNNNGTFYLARNGSQPSNTSTYLMCASNKWYINTNSGGEQLNVGGWIGTNGNTGWYNSTWAGGWYMSDADWIRSYNNKPVQINIANNNAWGIGTHRLGLAITGTSHVSWLLNSGSVGYGFCVNTDGNWYFGKRISGDVKVTTGDSYLLYGNTNNMNPYTNEGIALGSTDHKFSTIYAKTVNAYGGNLISTQNGNTVTVGSMNASWCHIYNSADIPFIFNKSVCSSGANTDAGSALGSLDYPWHVLYLGGSTGATMDNTTTNPRIVFMEGTGTQRVALTYTDYNSYRASKGLKVHDADGSDTDNVWFEVQGACYCTGLSSSTYVTALATNSSDKRLKKNIKPFNATEIVEKLKPIQFEWNSKAKKYNKNFKDGKNYGLIAQDSDGIIDDLVFDLPDGKGYKGVRYEKLIPILLQAIKEQSEKIENLEYEINVLKGVYK